MKKYLRVFALLTRRQRLCCVGLMFMMIVGGCIEACGIGLILPLIAVMGNDNFLHVYPAAAERLAAIGIHTHGEFVVALSVLLIAVFLFKNLYITAQRWLQAKFITKTQVFFSNRLFVEYLKRPYLYHLNNNSVVTMRNIGMGTQTVFNQVLFQTLLLFSDFVTVFIIWLMLVYVDPLVSIVVAGLFGAIIVVVVRALRRRIARQAEIQVQVSAEIGKWMKQGLEAIKETKLMGKEAFFSREYANANSGLLWALSRFNFIIVLPRTFIEFTVVFALLSLIIVKVLMGENTTDIVALLGVLALAAFRLMPGANHIIDMLNQLRFAFPVMDLVYEDLLSVRRKVEAGYDFEMAEHKHKRLSFERAIKVEHVSFGYPDSDKVVLQDINFSIPKGSFVGIVGPSGAGKTTFVDILLGLLEPVSGGIFVDNQDISKNMAAWQANLGYVPQSIYLIDGSIRDNIALGVRPEDVDEALLKKVIGMAQLEGLINDLPAGVDTPIGEAGNKLSGGQRQRIGIARALYRQPDVLVLDEATSALDQETEYNITETILHLKRSVTIVAIAHRLSTLAGCDFKVRIEKGVSFIERS